MSDLAKTLKAAKSGRVYKTAVTKILERMKAEDPKAVPEFLAALTDVERVSSSSLAEILTDAGYPVSSGAIVKHRRDARIGHK